MIQLLQFYYNYPAHKSINCESSVLNTRRRDLNSVDFWQYLIGPLRALVVVNDLAWVWLRSSNSAHSYVRIVGGEEMAEKLSRS